MMNHVKRIASVCCLILSVNAGLTNKSFCQTEEIILVKPVTPITSVIKYSTAIVKNNLPYDGTLNGYLNDNKTFIKDFKALETVVFETNGYDSLHFFFDLPTSYVNKFIPVDNNEPFGFTISPVMQVSNFNMEVNNSDLKNLAGEKLYEIRILDDVDANRIEITPNSESSKYIEVWKIDSVDVIYQVRLKNKEQFVANLSEDYKKKWSKGGELKFDIGVILSENQVPGSEPVDYILYLKKNKKIKKSSS
ncbi:MAG: hypothetical protein ABIY50_09535 [Ignavibacteria bacterium]